MRDVGDLSRFVVLKALCKHARLVLVFSSIWVAVGCGEFRARQYAREGNRLFREGNYAAAVRAYSASEQLDDLPVVAFNKGLACRQLMQPGAKTRKNEHAVNCALDAFSRLQRLNPNDARAEQLYHQTLFEADRFETLARIYLAKLKAKPSDPFFINALIRVYSRAGDWDRALYWVVERAKRQPKDAEAQYAVGVFIYDRLFEKGGGPDKFGFDPRGSNPLAGSAPPFEASDIAGSRRIELADKGIEFLNNSLKIRPEHADAMTYLGLLYRQKSFALFADVNEWQQAVDAAENYRRQALTFGATQSAKQL